MQSDKVKHVLGLSGGKDSTALAVFMSQNFPDLDIEYFFTDTGEELDEVREYLDRLEQILGKQITYLDPRRDFNFWLKQFGNLLSFCTNALVHRSIKIGPVRKMGSGRVYR